MDRNQTRITIIVGLAVLAVLLTLSPLFMGSMMGGGTTGTWMMGGYGPGWGGWGWALMLLFWALLIGGIAMVVSWLFRQGPMGGSDTVGTVTSRAGGLSGLNILKQRYATGELTKEQYEQMAKDILPN